MNITIDLDTDLLHETIIALSERITALHNELAEAQSMDVIAIIRRQISRTYGARAGLEDALDGARLKGMPV